MIDMYESIGIAGPNDTRINNVSLSDMDFFGGFNAQKIDFSKGFGSIAQKNSFNPSLASSLGKSVNASLRSDNDFFNSMTGLANSTSSVIVRAFIVTGKQIGRAHV